MENLNKMEVNRFPNGWKGNINYLKSRTVGEVKDGLLKYWK